MSSVAPVDAPAAVNPTGWTTVRGGEMVERLKSFNWASTSLGPYDTWPQSLRLAVGVCMNSRFPMFVWWGRELINIYNDAYVPILGKRHPAAFGLPAQPTWHEIWSVVGPQADAVMQRGEATWNERVLLVMERHGYTEDTWFTWSYSPILDETGKVGGLFCACVEDTGWVLAERSRDRIAKELAEARTRLEATLTAAEIGTWTWDVASNAVVADENLARLFGISSADAAGGSIELYVAKIHPDDRERVRQQIATTIRESETYRQEYRIMTSSGDVRWLIARGRVERDEQGAATRLPGVVLDITERKRAEETLERFAIERERLLAAEQAARAEAEAANRAKDKFLAVLSHELRTPLSPVVMTIHAIEADAELPEKYRNDLAMVRRNIDLEVTLIDDLLDLSRVTSGKLRLQLQPVHVHDVLRYTIHNSQSEAADKRLRLVEDFRADNDLISADPARLQQIFWNLVRNAVKFTPAGGEIRVSTSSSGGDLLIDVHDSGIGIDPVVLPRIFDAFEQGEMPSARQFGGLGLGLAIAKAVVEMHGGAITAESAGRDRGATFTVRFRTLQEHRPATEGAGPSPARGENLATGTRILLVEDHPDTASMLSRLLRAAGFQVQTANSVAAALTTVSAEPFDIVVSDIGLPDATGYDLMRQLRDRHGLRGIALSGYGMEEDMRRSKEAGFVDHVVKPVNVAQLQTVIRRVLSSASGSQDADTA
jgi:PAS domain S-box-containing protein